MLPLYLAPMAGYTDAVFRRICFACGCTYTVSEMISAAALHYRDARTARLTRILPGEGPVVLQIFGGEPAIMAEGAEILLTGAQDGAAYAAPPVGIDINMGCPVRKITSNGEGSALMRDLPRAVAITEAVSAVCRRRGVPLTVKIRAGWDANSMNAPEMAVALAQAGANGIALHARTRAELYTPGIHLEILEKTAAALHAIPQGRDGETGEKRCLLIGNGDVTCAADALTMLRLGCDGVMIGRGALGNPWIFRQIADAAAGKPVCMPTPSMRREMAIRLVQEIVAEKGEQIGVREARGRAAYFIRGIRGSAAVRDALNHATTEAAFVSILETLGDTDERQPAAVETNDSPGAADSLSAETQNGAE